MFTHFISLASIIDFLSQYVNLIISVFLITECAEYISLK